MKPSSKYKPSPEEPSHKKKGKKKEFALEIHFIGHENMFKSSFLTRPYVDHPYVSNYVSEKAAVQALNDWKANRFGALGQYFRPPHWAARVVHKPTGKILAGR